MGFWIITAIFVIWTVAYLINLNSRVMVVEEYITRRKITNDHRNSKRIFEELEQR